MYVFTLINANNDVIINGFYTQTLYPFTPNIFLIFGQCERDLRSESESESESKPYILWSFLKTP